MKFLGKRIKMRRVELEMNQEQLAKNCKIATSTISGIEKHSKMPTLKILMKIKQALNVSLDYFFEE